jgi:hypothetical protein
VGPDLSVEVDVSVETVAAPTPVEREDHVHHDVGVHEHGSFTVARCRCGWRSYARRSRDLARREGADHVLLHTAEA